MSVLQTKRLLKRMQHEQHFQKTRTGSGPSQQRIGTFSGGEPYPRAAAEPKPLSELSNASIKRRPSAEGCRKDPEQNPTMQTEQCQEEGQQDFGPSQKTPRNLRIQCFSRNRMEYRGSQSHFRCHDEQTHIPSIQTQDHHGGDACFAGRQRILWKGQRATDAKREKKCCSIHQRHVQECALNNLNLS
jgi:hypothetical protein